TKSKVVHNAVENGDEETLRLLIEHGADLDAPDETGHAPIHHAALSNQPVRPMPLVDLSLPLALRLDRLPLPWLTSLPLAHWLDLSPLPLVHLLPPLCLCSTSTLETLGTYLVKLLLELGADKHVASAGQYYALHMAAYKGHGEVVQILAQAGCDLDMRAGLVQCTALHLAAQEEWDGVVGMLLEEGANPDVCDIDGCTVLHWASEKGRVDVVDLLLEAGANANALDEDNWTPLHLAVQHTHEEVTNALLMADADTNIQTKWGHTPLHWAAMYGIEGLVQLLLDHNASTTTLSKTAKLPRDIAIQNNHDAVLALLDGKVQWWSNEQVQKTVADDKTQCRAPGSAPEAEPAAHPAKVIGVAERFRVSGSISSARFRLVSHHLAVARYN
ncbi:hypothetical protein CYMTET_36593, partial [Cymbomonas tetramitiformis]